jgi:hypothetical protein
MQQPLDPPHPRPGTLPGVSLKEVRQELRGRYNVIGRDICRQE